MGSKESRKSYPQKDQQNVMGNEENKYMVPDPNRTVMNTRKSLKEEIVDEITHREHRRHVNLKVQDALKKYQEN
jgi:hypothetical protein